MADEQPTPSERTRPAAYTVTWSEPDAMTHAPSPRAVTNGSTARHDDPTPADDAPARGPIPPIVWSDPQ